MRTHPEGVMFSDLRSEVAAAGRMRSGVPRYAVWIGMIFCASIVMLPELVPALLGKGGFVWSPFRSMNYRVGDLYYYAAWVREALSSGFPVYSPSGHELRGTALIETWRFYPDFSCCRPGPLHL